MWPCGPVCCDFTLQHTNCSCTAGDGLQRSITGMTHWPACLLFVCLQQSIIKTLLSFNESSMMLILQPQCNVHEHGRPWTPFSLVNFETICHQEFPKSRWAKFGQTFSVFDYLYLVLYCVHLLMCKSSEYLFIFIPHILIYTIFGLYFLGPI